MSGSPGIEGRVHVEKFIRFVANHLRRAQRSNVARVWIDIARIEELGIRQTMLASGIDIRPYVVELTEVSGEFDVCFV